MSTDSSSFARAVTDFWTDDLDEVSCTVNDVLKILRKENRRTVFAKNLHTGLNGKLPTYCLEPFEIPFVDPTVNAVFVALRDFSGTENGDLNLTKGAIVIGERAVDDNWWYGWTGNKRGIFPLEWVLEISKEVFEKETGDILRVQQPYASTRDADNVTVVNGSDQTQIPDILSDLNTYTVPPPLGNLVNQPDSGITCPHARALYDFDTGLSNELSFRSGDIIFLHRYADSNWLEGEQADGKRGIFPKDFVKIIVDVFENYNTNSEASDNELVSDGAEFEDFPPDTYAIVVSEYVGSGDNELHLKNGDAVTILRKRGQNWVEAMDDYGNVGFCPTNCLEIIGTEPDEIRSSSQIETSSSSSVSSYLSGRSVASPTFSMDSVGAINGSFDKRSTWHGSDSEMRSPSVMDASVDNRGYRSDRTKVMDEIISSEKDYIDSLSVCMEVLRKDPPPDTFDYKAVFGNIDEILTVAKGLLRDMIRARNNDGQIGEAFLRNVPSLKRAYMTYCQSNEATIALLCQYKDIALLDEYMKRKVAEIRLKTNCFDLASMFIKPLQRVLKYPLLLSELLKATDKSHSDCVFVRDSLKHSTDIASGINELKRRKELVAKYRDHHDTSFSERLSRFSFHSVVKKSSRIGLLVSSSIGFTTLMQDPTFQAAERRFQITKRTIKWFLRNVADFVEQLRGLLPILTSIADDFAAVLKDRPDGLADSFTGSQEAVSKQIIHEFIPKIKVHVVQPLEETLNQFTGPVKLIGKRHAKLIDYENAKRKIDRIKDGQRTQAMFDEVDLAKKVYQALNTQLVEELPKFNEATANILRTRVDAFLHFRKLFFYACSTAIMPCIKAISSGNRKGSEKTFAQKIETVISELKRLDYGSAVEIPTAGDPCSEDSPVPVNLSDTGLNSAGYASPSAGNFRRSESLPAGHRRPLPSPSAPPPTPIRASVASKPSELRFKVINDYRAKDPFDLSVRRGDLVDVIKQHTPMGSNERWFVKHNGVTGFLPKSILENIQGLKGVNINGRPDNNDEVALSSIIRQPMHMDVQSVAAFAFVPYGPHQLPLKQGDKVTVMADHDLDGNKEWSYVQNSFGAQGYVPSAYLKRFVGMASQ